VAVFGGIRSTANAGNAFTEVRCIGAVLGARGTLDAQRVRRLGVRDAVEQRDADAHERDREVPAHRKTSRVIAHDSASIVKPKNHTVPPTAASEDFLIPTHPLRPLTPKVVSFHDLALVPELGLERGAANAASASPAQATVMSTPPPDFRAIYDAHFDFVWRSLRRLGVREPDALDLTQKVFLTAHVKLAEFEGRSQISTWLFGIAQRVASDYRRSALIRREVSTDHVELDAVASSPAEFSADSEQRQRARAAEAILNALPEAQRTVFVLFELEEMSGQDIATLLDVSLGTVKSRLRLARDTFRREVKRLAALRAGGRKEAV